MNPNSTQRPLRALPIQIVDCQNSVILRRGCTQFQVSGEEAGETVRTILTAVTHDAASPEDICARFPPSAHGTVSSLIEQLVERKFLIPSDSRGTPEMRAESAEDIFFWHLGTSPSAVAETFRNLRFAIIGVNYVSKSVITALAESNGPQAELVDYLPLRNLRLFDESGVLIPDQWPTKQRPPQDYTSWAATMAGSAPDCVIVTSDFGYTRSLRDWNGLCIKNGRHFFPVVLHNLIGYLGPLVIPGETACYACLRSRQNSHLAHPDLGDAMESHSFEGQIVSGFHPLMASALGLMAAFELVRFYSGAFPAPRAERLIEVNLLSRQMLSRKVLKVPRCPTCTPLRTKGATNVKKVALSRGPL